MREGADLSRRVTLPEPAVQNDPKKQLPEPKKITLPNPLHRMFSQKLTQAFMTCGKLREKWFAQTDRHYESFVVAIKLAEDVELMVIVAAARRKIERNLPALIGVLSYWHGAKKCDEIELCTAESKYLYGTETVRPANVPP
ncbi:hypothetical protein H0H92_001317 [Tricholoma furcatifolium]|nr:hypothetical protein H0H92_001317 [Tricholoma furcatifolium]